MEERINDWAATSALEREGRELAARRYSKRLAIITFIGLGAIFAASLFYTAGEAGPDGNYFTICLFKNIDGAALPGLRSDALFLLTRQRRCRRRVRLSPAGASAISLPRGFMGQVNMRIARVG